MFAEYISRIQGPRNMLEVHHASSNGFPSVVVGKCMVSLFQRGMWNRAVGDNRTVVPKQARCPINGHSEVAKGGAKADDLFRSLSSGNEFGPIGRTFHSGLFLCKPFYRSLVDEMQDASHGTSLNPVMVEVGVLTCGGNN